MSSVKKGFTLSELLISLSVLGLISALTLPSVFNAVKKQKDKAIVREGFNTMVNVSTDSYNEGAVTSATTYIDYVKKNMNVTYYCPLGEDNPTKPCNINNRANRASYDRFTVASGATFAIRPTDRIAGKVVEISMYLDANNKPAPAWGDFGNVYNFSNETVTDTDIACGDTVIKPGELRPLECSVYAFDLLYN
jgi:prepilin-type N-terminal cleavage/methylation domain-containing protein